MKQYAEAHDFLEIVPSPPAQAKIWTAARPDFEYLPEARACMIPEQSNRPVRTFPRRRSLSGKKLLERGAQELPTRSGSHQKFDERPADGKNWS